MPASEFTPRERKIGACVAAGAWIWNVALVTAIAAWILGEPLPH